MIDIYKKLPGTNCGRCGLPTCMAFALKVKNAQALISECPYVAAEAAAEHPEKGRGPFSSFDQVAAALEKEVVAMDFREAAEATECRFGEVDGKESITVRMLNREYVFRKEGLFENGLPSRDVWAKIIIYDYLRRKGASSLRGELITLGHFPHTASHVKAFQASAEGKISSRFGSDLAGLKQRSLELGGRETVGRVKADVSFRFDLLPHIPCYLSFWQADEEFAAACKLHFDRSASDHIDIEYLAALVERFVEELARD